MDSGFHGLPTRTIESKHLRLEFLSNAGPRIVRLMLADSDENLLVEIPDMSIETPLGLYFFQGGHRLWHSPESFPGSYIPDNEGVTVQEVRGGVRLSGRTEEMTGIKKSIEIHLDPDRPAVTLHHVLQNQSAAPVELAAWPITQLPLGGVAILPQAAPPADKAGLLPNRNLVLWPYTRWEDPRLAFHDDYVLFHANAMPAPCKVGYLNHPGWTAYLRAGVLFVKRFEPQTDRPHPDFTSNAEVYGRDRFFELESIGPLTKLEPGQAAAHTEIWEIYSEVTSSPGVEGIRSMVRDLKL